MSIKENLIASLLVLFLLIAVIGKKILEKRNINSFSNSFKTIETDNYLDSSKSIHPKKELDKKRDPKEDWLRKYEKNLKFNSFADSYP